MSILTHSRAMLDGPPSYAASSCSTTSGEGQGTDTHLADKSPSGAKRRASRAGTRSVSTLTPAQLQRKRANDREAQRAIRQRNKEHIENLERRIEELSIGNVDAAMLVNLKQRVKELEGELSKANENLAASRTQQISSHPVWQARSNGDLVHPSSYSSNNQGMIMSTRSNFTVPEYDTPTGTFSSSHGLIVTEPEDGKNFTLNDDQDLQRSWVHPSMGLDQSSPMAFSSPTPYPHQVPAFYPGGSASGMATSSFMAQPSMHAYEIPIRYAPPTGMVDNLLISVLQTQRRQILEGTIRAPSADAHYATLIKSGTSSPIPATEPISHALTRILCEFASVRMNLAEKVAAFYIMHKLLQWQILPTNELYSQLPVWFTPQPIQLAEVHPIWVSQILWPRLRDKIIRNQDIYATRELNTLYASSLRVNWPYGEADILMFVDGQLKITPVFEKHIRELGNWSLAQEFTLRYPELMDCFDGVGG